MRPWTAFLLGMWNALPLLPSLDLIRLPESTTRFLVDVVDTLDLGHLRA